MNTRPVIALLCAFQIIIPSFHSYSQSRSVRNELVNETPAKVFPDHTQPPETSAANGGQPRSIRSELNNIRNAYIRTGSKDIFIWNLETYKIANDGNPAVQSEIQEFMRDIVEDQEFAFLLENEYQHQLLIFRFLVAKAHNLVPETDVKADTIISLIAQSQLFAGIRIAAIDTLTSFDQLSENEKDMAKYALSDLLNIDNSCAVRQHAVMALGSVGDIDVLDALRKALADECVEVQTTADKTIRSILARQNTSKDPSVPVAHSSKSRHSVNSHSIDVWVQF